MLLKRAYTLDKEALGPDAIEVGQHLIGLGGAYHQQGKLEAASLTLEEARSILVYALGPDAPQVHDVTARIKQLSVIEVDTSPTLPPTLTLTLPPTLTLTLPPTLTPTLAFALTQTRTRPS